MISSLQIQLKIFKSKVDSDSVAESQLGETRTSLDLPSAGPRTPPRFFPDRTDVHEEQTPEVSPPRIIQTQAPLHREPSGVAMLSKSLNRDGSPRTVGTSVHRIDDALESELMGPNAAQNGVPSSSRALERNHLVLPNEEAPNEHETDGSRSEASPYALP